jgi:hypothetical protein
MSEKSPNQATATQRFWDAFKASLEDNRIRPDRSPFYVKWAQAFVDFLPGKKLRNRSVKDIESFLADLRNHAGIAGKGADLAVRVPSQKPVGGPPQRESQAAPCA